jgi:uncharacterized protein
MQEDSRQTASATTAVGPLAPDHRIALLDILRGVAVLGILMMNIEDFAGPESATFHDIPVGLSHPAFVAWHAPLDYIIFAVKWTFFEGKMRALFAMLFGASTVLLLDRVGMRHGEARAADIFHRRNMWLVAIGLAHGLFIWSGDILTQYAVFALLLYPLRNVAPRRLLVAGMAVWLVGGSIGSWHFLDISGAVKKEQLLVGAREAMAHRSVINSAQKTAVEAADLAASQSSAQMATALADGRLGPAASLARTREGFLGFFGAVVTSGLALEVVGAMITGMGLFGIGFLTGRLRTRTYVLVAAGGYAVSLPLAITGIWYSAINGFSVTSVLESMFYPYTFLQFSAAIANASLVILLARSGWLPQVGRTLASVGKMALTNYLVTSVLCRFVFSWGPWKLYGELEYFQYLYVVGVVWSLNLLGSRFWLHFFLFGPIEWIWRSLTYWKFQPLLTTRQRTA